MSNEAIRVSGPINDAGLVMSLETGRLAQLADGAVLVQLGDTTLLSTVVTSKPREGIDFFPLTVDVEERMYAAGKIPGSFFRREGRPGEAAILTCRLTDRPLRPSFPEGFRNEVQVIATILGADLENPHDIASINGASAALDGLGHPVQRSRSARCASRTSTVSGTPTPPTKRATTSTFEMVVAGRRLHDGDIAIMMVEAGGTEQHLEALRERRAQDRRGDPHRGPRVVQAVDRRVDRPAARAGEEGAGGPRPDRRDPVRRRTSTTSPTSWTRSADAVRRRDQRGHDHRRQDRAQQRSSTRSSPASPPRSSAATTRRARSPVATARSSGRSARCRSRSCARGSSTRASASTAAAPRDLRPLSADVDLIPTAHGTGLFQRGETQVLSVTTLGMPRMEQMVDTHRHRRPQALHAPLQLPAVLHR